MARKPAKPIPDGYHAVTPWVVTRDTAGLIDFITRAFGGKELARMQGEGGLIDHAEMRIGDSVVMMFDARPGWPPTPALLRLYVDDAKAAHARALKASARSITEVTLLAFGDEVGRVLDPFGNLWWLQGRVEEVSPEEMTGRFGDPKAMAAMTYVKDSLAGLMANGMKPSGPPPKKSP